jgi:hypothetical protein
MKVSLRRGNGSFECLHQLIEGHACSSDPQREVVSIVEKSGYVVRETKDPEVIGMQKHPGQSFSFFDDEAGKRRFAMLVVKKAFYVLWEED